jgi:hypothetical protein
VPGTGYLGPLRVPDGFWDRSDVRQAVAVRDIAAILTLLHKCGASQTQIGSAIDVAQPHIGAIMRGIRKVVAFDLYERIADGLCMPDRTRMDFGLAPRRVEPRTSTNGAIRRQVVPLQPQPSRGNNSGPRAVHAAPSTADQLIASALTSDEGDDTKRRQFLATNAALYGLALIGADDHPLNIEDFDDEQLLGAPCATYRRLEQRLPSRSLIPSVRAHLALIHQLASRTEPTTARDKRLHALLSETAGLAAWLYADVEDRATARQHYRLAVLAAQRSGNPLLVAYMQASMGQFAANAGDAVESVRLVAASRALLPKGAPLIASIWMDAIEAFAFSQVHDRDALIRLERAESRLARAQNDEPVWPWIFRFDDKKLSGFRAQVAAKLGDVDIAQRALQAAHDPQQAAKPRALADILRADLLAQSGDLDEACRVAIEAFDIGRRYDSERVTRAVAEFRTSLRPRVGIRSQVTADLDERLYATYQETT